MVIKNPPPIPEYRQLQEYYKTNDGTQLPHSLHRLEIIFRFIYPLIEKGLYTQQQMVNMVVSHFRDCDNHNRHEGFVFNITHRKANDYVNEARNYFCEAELEDSKIHRLRVVKLAYKQIELMKTVSKQNPIQANKQILELIYFIAKVMRLDEEEQIATQMTESFFILSDNANDFPDLKAVPEYELIEMIDKFTKDYDLSEREREQLIHKDVEGALI